MRKIWMLTVLLGLALNGVSQPLPVKNSHTVIIDSDCAIDDMRAISLLLSLPRIRVEAVITSDGSLPPREGAHKVLALLHEFNAHQVEVATGEELKSINPPWRDFNRSILWGDQDYPSIASDNAVKYLAEKLKGREERVVMICLGPLTNIARLIASDKSVLSKIERLIWYNESVNPPRGFNYECDKAGADLVLSSDIRIDVISNGAGNHAMFDTSLVALSLESETRLASVISKVYSQPVVMERLKQNHFRLCDDLVVLYLTNPELFGMNILPHRVNIRYATGYQQPAVKEALADMIKGTYVQEKNVVFNKFPDTREMFNYDIRPIMDSAISRYGRDEWKANVMTDEFHGHLGVFSIVGAKMGIRARDYFNAGPDVLKVITFAGSRPPYSCLNDGIQVSTGATLGMGTIKVSADTISRPSAIFTYRDKSILITLKKEYLARVDADIAEGIVKFGLMDDGYWKLIRQNAIKYWLEWDRNEIFDVSEIR